MTAVENDFWRNIFRGSTEGPSLSSRRELLSETEIHEFYVTLVIQKHVLWFKIPINNVPRVKIFESLEYTPCVKSGCVVVKKTPTRERDT